MKSTSNYKPKTNQQSPKSDKNPKILQIRTVLSEADYYDYEADLAEEKAHYLQLRYNY